MKIAFTSCISYDAFPSQPEWDYISNQNPDYLFLLGDLIYMDYGYEGTQHNGAPEHYQLDEFIGTMRQKYHVQFEVVSNFKKLVAKMREKNGFHAIWDDHDFAWDNAKGVDVKQNKKEASRDLFHEFTNCSNNKPHVYYAIDTPMARIIFLDNRWDSEHPSLFEKKQLLSNEQFDFIEEKLNHDLPYTVICGGITLTEGHENWRKYRSQLKKLCKLLEGKNKVFFLGGDIHKNVFIKPQTFGDNEGYTTPCQLISSGLQIDFLDFEHREFDDCHNWAILELSEDEAKVTFYKKDIVETDKSDEANQWIRNNFFSAIH